YPEGVQTNRKGPSRERAARRAAPHRSRPRLDPRPPARAPPPAVPRRVPGRDGRGRARDVALEAARRDAQPLAPARPDVRQPHLRAGPRRRRRRRARHPRRAGHPRMGRAGRPPERPLSMPYRVTFHAAASASIPGLPAEAFEALVEVLVMAGRDPYKTGSPDPDDPAHRHAT